MARHDGKSAEASLNGCAVRHAGGEAMMSGARANRRNPAVRAAVVGCLVALLAACTTAAEHRGTERNRTPVCHADTGRRRAGIGTGRRCADTGRRAAGCPGAGHAIEPVQQRYRRLLYRPVGGGGSCGDPRRDPDLVTLNEICQDDLPILQQALAEVIPDGGVVSAFQGARDRRSGDDYRCRNGQPYGIGLISRWPCLSRWGVAKAGARARARPVPGRARGPAAGLRFPDCRVRRTTRPCRRR